MATAKFARRNGALHANERTGIIGASFGANSRVIADLQ
jgi:hypothetical protein